MKKLFLTAGLTVALASAAQAKSFSPEETYILGVTGTPDYLVAYHCAEGSRQPSVYKVDSDRASIRRMLSDSEHYFNRTLTWASERAAYREGDRIRLKVVALGSIDRNAQVNDGLVQGEFSLDEIVMSGSFDQRLLTCS